MSNLRPEVRVNKNGVPVTKHVRDGRTEKKSLLARIVPFVSRNLESEDAKARRQELTNDLAELYVSSYSKFMDRIEASYSSSEDERNRVKVAQFLKSYSSETMELIHASYADGNGDSFRRFVGDMEGKSESFTRSYALYQHCGIPANEWETVSQEVSSSLDIDDIASLAYGSAEHEQVSMVIFWAKEARIGRSNKFYNEDSKFGDWDDVISDDKKRERSIRQMTPAFARIALEFPERAKEVSDYMVERKFTPESFDEEHLRMTLTNGAKAMNDGVL